jgi:hypothetical protein
MRTGMISTRTFSRPYIHEFEFVSDNLTIRNVHHGDLELVPNRLEPRYFPDANIHQANYFFATRQSAYF